MSLAPGTRLGPCEILDPPGVPVALFQGGFGVPRLRDFDIAPDGRFVVARHGGGGAGSPELRMPPDREREGKRVAGAAK